MKRTVIAFTIMSIIAKIIAFGRELVLSYFYGAGEISDVFILSMTLPGTIFGFIASGVTSGFIPVYEKAKSEKGNEEALRYTNNVINTVLVICIVVIITYFVIPRQLLALLASGFDKETLELARHFTNVSIWATALIAIVTVFSGYLQINDRIKITALVSIPLNIGVIISIILSVLSNNVFILPIGFLISTLFQTFFLWINCRKSGYRYSCIIDRKNEYLKLFFSSLLMLIFSGSLQQINVLIDRTLATTVVTGGLSIFEYGNKISDFVMGLTIIPISTALFPVMTKNKEDNEGLVKVLSDGIRLSSLVIIPSSAVLMVFSEVIVRILYYRGAFDIDALQKTSEIVMFYGGGLVAFSLREMILKCFYAVGNVKLPMINSSIGVVCNIVLNFILLKVLGLGGLALATSLSAFISVFLLYCSLKKYLGDIHLGKTIIRCLELVFISIAICYGAFVMYKHLSFIMNGIIYAFFISLIAYAIVYFFVVFKFNFIEKEEVINLIKRR